MPLPPGTQAQPKHTITKQTPSPTTPLYAHEVEEEDRPGPPLQVAGQHAKGRGEQEDVQVLGHEHPPKHPQGPPDTGDRRHGYPPPAAVRSFSPGPAAAARAPDPPPARHGAVELEDAGGGPRQLVVVRNASVGLCVLCFDLDWVRKG